MDPFSYSTNDSFRHPAVSSKLNANAPEFVLSSTKSEVKQEEPEEECHFEEQEEPEEVVENSPIPEEDSVNEEVNIVDKAKESPLVEPENDIVESTAPPMKEETLPAVEKADMRKPTKPLPKLRPQPKTVSTGSKVKKQPEKKKRTKKRKIVKTVSSPSEEPLVHPPAHSSFRILHSIFSFSSNAIQKAILYLNHQETTVLLVNFLFLLLYTLV